MSALPTSIVSAPFAGGNRHSRRRFCMLAANDGVLPPDEWRVAQRDIPDDDVHGADEIMAARLIVGGLDPEEVYYDHDPLAGETVVALDGSGLRRVLEGGRLRRWPGFPSQALSKKKKVGREYGVFGRENGIENTDEVRVTPPEHQIPLTEVRRAHAKSSIELNKLIRAASKKTGVKVDMIGAHFAKDKLQDGTAYQHFHLVARSGDLNRFKEYFTKNGWEVDPDKSENSDEHTIYSLPQYLSGGLAASACEDWTHAELAELFRQTRGLSLCRAVGEFRKFLHDLEACDQVIDQNGDIRARWRRDRPTRRPEWLFRTAGFRALFVTEWDYGDGVKRPAVVVSGRTNVTASEIAIVYHDLRNNTAIPKHVHDQRRHEDPPPKPREAEPGDDQVPF